MVFHGAHRMGAFQGPFSQGFCVQVRPLLMASSSFPASPPPVIGEFVPVEAFVTAEGIVIKGEA